MEFMANPLYVARITITFIPTNSSVWKIRKKGDLEEGETRE